MLTSRILPPLEVSVISKRLGEVFSLQPVLTAIRKISVCLSLPTDGRHIIIVFISYFFANSGIWSHVPLTGIPLILLPTLRGLSSTAIIGFPLE